MQPGVYRATPPLSINLLLLFVAKRAFGIRSDNYFGDLTFDASDFGFAAGSRGLSCWRYNSRGLSCWRYNSRRIQI